MLFDHDPQGSSLVWLNQRAHLLDTQVNTKENSQVNTLEKTQTNTPANIQVVAAYQIPEHNVTRTWQLRVPPATDRVVIDTPAGLTSQELVKQVQGVDVILIPALPSLLDIRATANFIRDLLLIGHTRSKDIRIGIIANRVRSNTHSLQRLRSFLKHLKIPVLGYLRDTQLYLHAIEQGVGIHELSARDQQPWHEIVNWIEQDTLETVSVRASVAVARGNSEALVP